MGAPKQWTTAFTASRRGVHPRVRTVLRGSQNDRTPTIPLMLPRAAPDDALAVSISLTDRIGPR